MRSFLFAAVACGVVAAGYFLTPSNAADPAKPAPVAAVVAPVPPQPAPERLIAHEWGTFTSFSGSNGVAVSFRPNNEDLPDFVYHQGNPYSKSGQLNLNGLISMETPVVYFYTDRETKVSVQVDFPRGWITEWYPFASTAPSMRATKNQMGGQVIRWNARLLPGETAKFPIDRNNTNNPYYHARETDATPLQTEMALRDDHPNHELRGGTVVQRERLLFYRGVGSFPPPVTVKALGGDRVRVVNGAGEKVGGLVLVTVRGGKVGFRPLGEVGPGSEMDAMIPEPNGSRADLAEFLVRELTAAGLYEKESRAMVKTWNDAWFGEEGTRLLYLVPRAKTDELLPISIEPRPTELVRVLVGRHDFLTPEQEATADRQVQRLRAAEAELNAAQRELSKLGRFSYEARTLAGQRLDAAAEVAAAAVAGGVATAPR
jgi:hypothetical protein